MDTVTLIRSALRNVFKAADDELEAGLRAVLTSGDDYASGAKPQIDWDDAAAREALIDSRAKDAFACLVYLDGRTLGAGVADAARLLATVVGQDLEEGDDGRFRIARRVAADRVISTVDPQARHGHKTSARGFDGYKGHAAIDPDSEIITDTVVTPGNAGDASVAEDLIDDLLHDPATTEPATTEPATTEPATTEPATTEPATTEPATTEPVDTEDAGDDTHDEPAQPAVYGDAAYGTGKFLSRLHDAGIEAKCKTQPPVAAGGMFSKDHFYIELGEGIVTCPAGEVAEIHWAGHGGGMAYFAPHCATCPLAPECTKASGGRTITISAYEQILTEARHQQTDPDWVADYRGTRPKVERKLGHLMRRKHGGRRARVRGTTKVDADFNLLAAATNMARLAVLGLRSTITGGWTAAT